MHSKLHGASVRLLCQLALVLAASACGDDSSGPETNFAGTYPGEFYAIVTSTGPSERDSVSGGDVTLTLERTDENRYHFSVTSGVGGSAADIVIDQAGAVSFPAFDQEASLDFISSFLFGICDLSSAAATPSGSVVDDRLTISVLATGGTCDWSAGQGTDVRPTDIRVTWTGERT
jgi:hypothetical protein